MKHRINSVILQKGSSVKFFFQFGNPKDPSGSHPEIIIICEDFLS